MTCQDGARTRRGARIDGFLRALVRAMGALDALLLASFGADGARRAARVLASADFGAPAALGLECARVLLAASLPFGAVGLLRLRRWGALVALIQLPIRLALVPMGYRETLFAFQPLLVVEPLLPPRAGAHITVVGIIAALEVLRALAIILAWRRGTLFPKRTPCAARIAVPS